MTDALVGEAHVQLMRGFTDYDTIDARLGGKPIIIQEYVTRAGGWTRCGIIPVNRDENGRNLTVLYVLRDITAEREEMETQNGLIAAQSLPYGSIYAVNADTGLAICCRMGEAIKERYGRGFASGSYERNIGTYIDNDVLPEDRHLFDRVRTVGGVNELLSGQSSYAFSFRVDRGGRVQYFRCQLVKPSPERNEFVIAFKDIDGEKRQELARQRQVQEALEAVKKSNDVLLDEMEIPDL